jgi:hypothetical protein
VIEDVLRMYVMDKPSKWEDYLHLVEFAYNNGYQASLKMSPFEALYGRKCNTPVSWDNPTNRVVVGPYLLREMEEKMIKIKQNLKAAQDRQKIYADKGITHREFKVGGHVFLKVKAKRSSLKLGNFSKLAARYCGPFEILERIGPVSYMIAFPASMSVHNVFHVSCSRIIYLMLIMLLIGMLFRWSKKALFKCIRYTFWTRKSNRSGIEP